MIESTKHIARRVVSRAKENVAAFTQNKEPNLGVIDCLQFRSVRSMGDINHRQVGLKLTLTNILIELCVVGFVMRDWEGHLLFTEARWEEASSPFEILKLC